MIVLAILYEGLKTLRDVLMAYDRTRNATGNGDENEGLLNGPGGRYVIDYCIILDITYKITSLFISPRPPKEVCWNVLTQYINPFHIIQSVLHVVQVGWSYILMLVAMTYNGWLFLAVCVGAGLGYYIFGKCRQSFSREQNEHCH